MSGFKEPGFNDRQKAAQKAKQDLLAKFRAQPGPDDPEVAKRRAEREAIQAEGVATYKMLISTLLDITDNIGSGKGVIPPADVVRHEGDDPYLVVAADKGTATFSDIANELAIARFQGRHVAGIAAKLAG